MGGGGGGGKSMQEVLAEPAGKGAGRCLAKRGSFDFFEFKKLI